MLRAFIFAGVLILTSTPALADLMIATWNIQRLGSNNEKNFDELASISGHADFLAIQEVMTDEAVSNLEAALEKSTGLKWSSIESVASGRGSYKEHYAFIWKDAAVSYVDGAVSYLDRRDIFEREPFSAKFEELATGREFIAATVHVIYGAGPSVREPEIRELASYWSWLGDVYPGVGNTFLMGDFNTPPSDRAWKAMAGLAKPSITTGASTLSETNGRFVSLYDNVWTQASGGPTISKAFVVNYPKLIGWSHSESRKHISDHAPVFVQANLAERSNTPLSANSGATGPFAAQAQGRVIKVAQKSAMAAIRGNRRTMTYHREDCPSYNAVGVKNRVEFKSAEAAETAGFRLAGNCP